MSSSSSSLSLLELSYLTLQAVLQAVIICSFGYVCAKTKLIPPSAQRHISHLNVQLFTPCLIFTKLASSLNLKTLIDISIIPVFYTFSTLITYSCSRIVSKFFGFSRRETNFVTAMGVFGNSNSVPVTITVAMAYSLPGLEWSNIVGDNQDKIASRGIMYLLIFQQLGQTLRWSWGYNTLLAKPTPEDLIEEQAQIPNSYEDLEYNIFETQHEEECIRQKQTCDSCPESCQCPCDCKAPSPPALEDGNAPAPEVLIGERSSLLRNDSLQNISYTQPSVDVKGKISGTTSPTKPLISSSNSSSSSDISGQQHRSLSGSTQVNSSSSSVRSLVILHPSAPRNAIEAIPVIGHIIIFLRRSLEWFLDVMNPPLWAMLLAVTVASIPYLQGQFYTPGTFVEKTLSSAIRQMGGVAIPLILVILGSNLCPDETQAPPSRNYNKLIIAGLMSRIFMPSFIIIPIVTLCIKYLDISILDDPIFLLVAFLLTIAPPAIQLSQISQLNKVFEREMAGVLFWGYAVVTLPTTIVIVVLAIKLLDWVH